MVRDETRRLEKAKQEVGERCLKLFEELYKLSSPPTEFKVQISAISKGSGEIRTKGTSVVIPKPINYKTMGKLTGKIRDHQVSALSDGEGHYKVTIDSRVYPRLPRKLVEEQLGIPVQKKMVGDSSETIGRAVWRHLTGRYNLLDRTVGYFDEFVYY